MNSVVTFLKFVFIIWFLLSSKAISNTLNKIEIIGNDRISDETIKLFISINKDDEINDVKLNNILNDLYETNFFKNISVNFKDQILVINVEENPIIENIYYNGIKSQRILELIKQNSYIKSRSSFNESFIKKRKIKN
jgi:outer membrane protein insertion porin family